MAVQDITIKLDAISSMVTLAGLSLAVAAMFTGPAMPAVLISSLIFLAIGAGLWLLSTSLTYHGKYQDLITKTKILASNIKKDNTKKQLKAFKEKINNLHISQVTNNAASLLTFVGTTLAIISLLTPLTVTPFILIISATCMIGGSAAWSIYEWRHFEENKNKYDDLEIKKLDKMRYGFGISAAITTTVGAMFSFAAAFTLPHMTLLLSGLAGFILLIGGGLWCASIAYNYKKILIIKENNLDQEIVQTNENIKNNLHRKSLDSTTSYELPNPEFKKIKKPIKQTETYNRNNNTETIKELLNIQPDVCLTTYKNNKIKLTTKLKRRNSLPNLKLGEENGDETSDPKELNKGGRHFNK